MAFLIQEWRHRRGPCPPQLTYMCVVTCLAWAVSIYSMVFPRSVGAIFALLLTRTFIPTCPSLNAHFVLHTWPQFNALTIWNVMFIYIMLKISVPVSQKNKPAFLFQRPISKCCLEKWSLFIPKHVARALVARCLSSRCLAVRDVSQHIYLLCLCATYFGHTGAIFRQHI
jgi:hypothetical protein